MKRSPLLIRKISPSIGCEISGIDLSGDISDALLEDLREALLDNLVIFFRDQHLTPNQHKAFGRRFGQLHIHPAPLGILDGHPEIVVVRADENSTRIAGQEWHSDVSCDVEPPMGSMLYLTEVPVTGGDTLFASMYAAYEALPDSMQHFLAGLTATHDGARNYEGRQPDPKRGPDFPSAEHPVVRTHPETGRSGLFVNRLFTTRILQLRKQESDLLLGLLFKHIENPEFQCRFRWQRNSLAFWDNRCTQHLALWDYYPQRRYGHRVTIAGDRPFYRS
jgi:taurine dioxygenase